MRSCVICPTVSITACKWDSVIPFEPLWEQYKRIIKPNGAICLFGSQPFTSALVMSNPKWFKYEWIWIKNKGSNYLNAKREPMKEHENILVFGDKIVSFYRQLEERSESGKLRHDYGYNAEKKQSINYGHQPAKSYSIDKNLRIPKSYQKFVSQNGIHPTQKPVALIEYLLKTYSLENELILDNTAGSGTLAIACLNTNRRYICIEKDPDYFEVMKTRIENHDPFAPVKPKKTRKPPKPAIGQLSLFG